MSNTAYQLFPAHAGVIPGAVSVTPINETFPRTRGGDPMLMQMGYNTLGFSPHTRG